MERGQDKDGTPSIFQRALTNSQEKMMFYSSLSGEKQRSHGDSICIKRGTRRKEARRVISKEDVSRGCGTQGSMLALMDKGLSQHVKYFLKRKKIYVFFF